MSKAITAKERAQAVTGETLEQHVRGQVQALSQGLWEAELRELLGRAKGERRREVDAATDYHNGHGKPRRLTLGSGTITVRRPRARGLEQVLESRLLPLFVRRSEQVDELLPELYLQGLAWGDFDLALRGLRGEQAPLSASTVARVKQDWQGEVGSQRSLEGLEGV